jgi:hypothetical protein
MGRIGPAHLSGKHDERSNRVCCPKRWQRRNSVQKDSPVLHELIRRWYAPLFSDASWHTLDRLALINEWATLATWITAKREGAKESLRVNEVALDSAGQLTIRYAFQGPHAAEVRADCGLLIEAATRMIAARFWRWNESSAWLNPVRPTWVQDFKLLYDPWWASCPIEIDVGWVSLMEALGLWACELTGGPADEPGRWLQVNEKFGHLRVSHRWPADHPLTAAVYACEAISDLVCETCGSPGFLRDDGPYLYTACREHLQ